MSQLTAAEIVAMTDAVAREVMRASSMSGIEESYHPHLVMEKSSFARKGWVAACKIMQTTRGIDAQKALEETQTPFLPQGHPLKAIIEDAKTGLSPMHAAAMAREAARERESLLRLIEMAAISLASPDGSAPIPSVGVRPKQEVYTALFGATRSAGLGEGLSEDEKVGISEQVEFLLGMLKRVTSSTRIPARHESTVVLSNELLDQIRDVTSGAVAPDGCCHRTRLRDAPCPNGRKCPVR